MMDDERDRSKLAGASGDDRTTDPAAGETGIPRRDYGGVGPTDEFPSDERIRAAIAGSLARHPEIDARDIQVAVHDGDVTLTGTVDDRGTKHMAGEVASVSYGVRHVHNELAVHRTDEERRAARETTERALDRAPEIDRGP